MRIVLSLVFLLSSTTWANFTQDVASIKKLTGCYNITYEDAETFSPTADYKFYERFKSGGTEWIFVERENDKEVVLLHLLVAEDDNGEIHIIKHWRQQWSYEDDHVYSFQGNNTWISKDIADSSGRWTQAAYQVGGGPRYECSAPWVRWGDVEYWECESNAPLPRREFSIRSDYNILKRRNRHEITSLGHVHSHDGTKVNKTSTTEEVIAFEKGRNTYLKTDEASCQPAKDWWKAHRLFWLKTHEAWDEVYKSKKGFKLKSKVEGQGLWMHLFMLDDKSTKENWDSFTILKEVSYTIDKFYDAL